jgi:DNA-binding Lrp family transcriptional regulator
MSSRTPVAIIAAPEHRVRVAQLDAGVLGLTFEALIFVTMRYADRQTVAAFEEQVAGIPHVLQAQRLFGDPDYLLRVVARDLPAYRQLYVTAACR